MRAEQFCMSNALLDQLKKTDRLPSAPGVAARVVELAQREDVGLDDLAEILTQDPALSAKIIRTANSSMFGVPREISSLNQAVMILGMRSVNMLALSFSISGDLAAGTNTSFDYARFWTTTAATAIGARVLAERCQPSLNDQAFLGGLLADIGQLVLVEFAKDEYAPVLEAFAASDKPLHEVESEVIGVTHMDVAGDLLDEWGLPFVVCHAIGAHHDPEMLEAQEGEAFALAKVLRVASACAELLANEASAEAVEEVRSVAQRYFDLSNEQIGELLEQIESQLPEMASLLDLEIQDHACLLQIRTKAMELLVQESMALEKQVQNVASEVGRLQEQNQVLKERATTDALTGLNNRGFLDEQLPRIFEDCSRRGHSFGVLMMDVDHFKSVNDTHGHPVGDKMLAEVAKVVAAAAQGNELACRYGGEEFSLIAPGISRTDLEERAETIRAHVALLELDLDDGTKLSRTISVGACYVERATGLKPKQALEVADQALYQAKTNGRDRVEVYNCP